jgi:hypothetical protein
MGSDTSDPAIFLPTALDVTQFGWNENYGNWVVLGRLNPRVTLEQASAQLNTIQTQIPAEPAYSGDRRPGALGAWIQPMREAVVSDSRTAEAVQIPSIDQSNRTGATASIGSGHERRERLHAS